MGKDSIELTPLAEKIYNTANDILGYDIKRISFLCLPKFVFAEDVVDFAGHTITLDSIKPTIKMLKAIKEFPTPTTIKGLRGWFGVIAFISYAFAFSAAMHPFRELLEKKRKLL